MIGLRPAYRKMRRLARTSGRLTAQLRDDFRSSRQMTPAGRFAPLPPSQGGRAKPLSQPTSVYLHGYEGARPRVPWPAYPPAGYLGQLDPGFQDKLAADRAYVTVEDCVFYHTVDLPGGEVIRGPWDLRGQEQDYLGHADLSGQRVLELGPATGHLSFYLERTGAQVVTLDVGWDQCPDLLPRPGVEMSAAQMELIRYIGTVQNSWWYLHRAYRSKVAAVYGNVYRVPADLGVFDTAFFGAILLHLREPFAALAAVADHVQHQMIVTDVVQDPDLDQDENLLRFAPQDVPFATNWWSMTPGAVVHMLERLGFTDCTVTRHAHAHHLDHDLSRPPYQMPMFTVVGVRP